jgi:CHAT domain-containing protein
MLGIGFVIPGYLREKIESTEEMSQLLAQEVGLTERRGKPGENDFALQQDLENLRNQMRGFPPLAELLSLREGQSETLQTLDWFFSIEEEATLVDWVFIEQKVYIITVDTERNVKMEEVKNDVNLPEWVEDYVTEEKERIKVPSDVASPLRMIDYLVEPLTRLTKPGCLLVFSPSGPLYSIPLHALQLPSKQLVIERNPIVYSVNMSVLHLCCLRSTRGHSPDEFVAMGFYPESTNEQKKVTENNKKIANMFGGISISGEDVVEASFQKHVEKAAIFHFHGHAVPDDDGNILDQYLNLFIPDNNESASPFTPMAASNSSPTHVFDDSNDMEEVEYIPPGFTVREILSLKLKAPLVTLMACESARQEVSPGDDPMGLVSAFLISGASSVVGTLWSVQSTDGRTFAHLFYQELQRQCFGNPKSGLMDLALATQRAVMTMRENPDTRAVYHWAPFVLHGSWKVKAFEVPSTAEM